MKYGNTSQLGETQYQIPTALTDHDSHYVMNTSQASIGKLNKTEAVNTPGSNNVIMANRYKQSEDRK